MKFLSCVGFAALCGCVTAVSEPQFTCTSGLNVAKCPDLSQPLETPGAKGRHASVKAWYKKASAEFQAGKAEKPCILFGDSLTANWRDKDTFNFLSSRFNVVRDGVCGDQIQHLLWRMIDLKEELIACPPAVALIMIGTNNLREGMTSKDRYEGVKNLVATLRSWCPETKIVVFCLPPMGLSWARKVFTQCAETSELYRTLADWEHVFYFDFSAHLLNPKTQEVLTDYIVGDCCHFSARGYNEVVGPFYAGAISLVTNPSVKKEFYVQNEKWYQYLKNRRVFCDHFFLLEERLKCDSHLNGIKEYWKQIMLKAMDDRKFVPPMPEEYARMVKEEGLPPEVR